MGARLTHRRLFIFAALTLAAGCKPEDTSQKSYTTDNGGDLLGLDPDTGEAAGGGTLGDCNEVVTKINGTPADEVGDPTVGDEWMIRMFCDGALLTGANRLFFQPAQVATVDDVSTDARFVAPGYATMTMQAGNLIYTKPVNVIGAE